MNMVMESHGLANASATKRDHRHDAKKKGKFWKMARIDDRKDKRKVKRSFTVVDDVSQRVDHTEDTDEPSDHFVEVDGPIKRQKPVHSSRTEPCEASAKR